MIELSVRVVNVVVPGIGVLDGVDVLQGERGILVGLVEFLPINLKGALFSRNVLDWCMKSCLYFPRTIYC